LLIEQPRIRIRHRLASKMAGQEQVRQQLPRRWSPNLPLLIISHGQHERSSQPLRVIQRHRRAERVPPPLLPDMRDALRIEYPHPLARVLLAQPRRRQVQVGLIRRSHHRARRVQHRRYRDRARLPRPWSKDRQDHVLPRREQKRMAGQVPSKSHSTIGHRQSSWSLPGK
jgi:hypothetical protein